MDLFTLRDDFKFFDQPALAGAGVAANRYEAAFSGPDPAEGLRQEFEFRIAPDQRRNEIKGGRFQGPTIYAAGPILYGPVDNAEKVVRAQKEQGFDFIKLYSFLSVPEFNDAIATAKSLNMYTAGHIPFAVGLDGILAAGMNEIAHIEELDFEFVDFDRSRILGHKEWFRYILMSLWEKHIPVIYWVLSILLPLLD